MPYSTSLPGVREAVKRALLSAMIAKLPDLNAALLNIQPALNVAYEGQAITSVTASQFYNGDFETLPDPAANWMWVTVESGGKQDGTDLEMQQQATGGDHKRTYWSEIHFYLQPDIFPPSPTDATGAQDQVTQRAIARDRFTDWLTDDVFSTYSAQALTLESQQFNPIADVLGECLITRVTAGNSYKGGGQFIEIYSAHFLHRGIIYGATP
jgi:hypothetical protein